MAGFTSALPGAQESVTQSSLRAGLSRRTESVLALALAGAVYLAALLHLLVPANMNPLALAHLSRQFPAERFWDQSPYFDDGVGFDGQFFYYLARDPLLLEGPPSYLDTPAFRYQRILYPLAASILSFGQAGLVAWALLAVNLGALGLGCWWFAGLCDHFGVRRTWLAAYALNPGFLLGVQNDLAEPLALALCTGAALAYVRGSNWLAAAALTLGLLAREPVLFVAAGFLLYGLLVERSWQRAVPFTVPIAAFCLWQLVVLTYVGALPAATTSGLLNLPITGALFQLRILLDLLGPAASSPDALLRIAVECVSIVGVVLVAFISLAGIAQRHAFGWLLAIQGGLVLVMAAEVWAIALSFGRAAMLLYLFLLLAAFASRHRDPVSPLPTPQSGQHGSTSAGSGRGS